MWKHEHSNLNCQPIDVEKRVSKQNAPFVAVKLNGTIEGKQTAFCWHASLFDALLSAKGCEAQFTVEMKDGYPYITEVLAVDGQEYRDGEPYAEPEPVTTQTPDSEPTAQAEEVFTGATDDDVPF